MPNIRNLSIIVVLGLAMSAARAQPTQTVGAAPVIGRIDIDGHSRTRELVIRRELLFVQGDTLDAQALSESARNLRRLLFIGRADIRTQVAAPGTLNVHVRVEDLYARALSPLFDGDLDEISYGGVAVDYNLFGMGRLARVSAYDDARSGRRITVRGHEPRLLGSRLRVATQVGWADEGHVLSASVAQPFYALSARWAFGLSLASQASRTRLYSGGSLAALYENRTTSAGLWLVRSYGRQIKWRPGLSLSVSDRSFSARNGFTYAPADRRRVLPSLTLTIWRPRYVTERFLRYLGPTEDLQTGSWFALRAGTSASILGSDRSYTFTSVTIAPRRRLREGWYLFSSAQLSLRRRAGGDLENVIASSSAHLLGRFAVGARRSALAARLRYDTLHRPEDTGSQYLLGGDSGLRGYPLRRFDGSRRLLANIELRPLFVHRAAWALGGAAFIDLGGAWDRRVSLHTSAGAGLRLGLPRIYDTPILRLDLARGVKSGIWQLSFGLGQPF